MDGIHDCDKMLVVVRNIFAPEADTDMSKVSVRERRQYLKEDILNYLTAKMALFNLIYPIIADFTTLRNNAINGMANKVIKRLVRRVKPADPYLLRAVAVRCVAGERQAYTGGDSNSTNLDGFTTTYV